MLVLNKKERCHICGCVDITFIISKYLTSLLSCSLCASCTYFTPNKNVTSRRCFTSTCHCYHMKATLLLVGFCALSINGNHLLTLSFSFDGPLSSWVQFITLTMHGQTYANALKCLHRIYKNIYIDCFSHNLSQQEYNDCSWWPQETVGQ